MQLALSGTEIAAAQGIEPLINTAQHLGVDCVEFWYPRNSEKLGLGASLARLSQAGIRVACVATATELCCEGDVSLAQHTITEAVRIAAEIECDMVNTYFGWPSVLDDHRAIEIYCRNLQPCLRAAEAAGVTLTLENEFDGLGCDPLGTDVTRRPESLAALMKTIDSTCFRVTFDPCNAYFAGVDPSHAYDILAPYITYVHLKDGVAAGGDMTVSPGWQLFVDNGHRYVTCPLGEGDIDWPQLFYKLHRDRYTGFLSLEPHCEPEWLVPAWKQAIDFVQEMSAGGAP